MQGLADIEELILLCRTERARTYIAEAYSAYKVGAYRSAIVTTWISVVFDIVDKLRELVLAGDGQAKTVMKEFDGLLLALDQGNQQVITKALAFEREILLTARDRFLLLDQHQFLDLERLRDDRNRCAHPTFHKGDDAYQPSAELARMHLRNAIVHVLQQPPVQGKAGIDAVLKSIESDYFPQTIPQARTLLEEGPLKKSSQALINGVVDRVLFGLFEKGNPLYSDLGGLTALQAMLQMHPAAVEARIKHQILKIASAVTDDGLRVLVGTVVRVEEAWGALSSGQRERVRQFILGAPMDKLARSLSSALHTLYLKEVAQERLSELSAEELKLVTTYDVGSEVVSRAVDLFCKAGSWSSANYVADALVIPLISHVSADDVRRILKSPAQEGADLISSGGLSRFVGAVRLHNILPLSELDDLLEKNNMSYLTDKPGSAIGDDEIPL